MHSPKDVFITVDWDYFVPLVYKNGQGKERYFDFGHQETYFHLMTLWSIRLIGDPRAKKIESQGWDTFWSDLPRDNNYEPVVYTVSDSHVWAHDVATEAVESGIEDVILVDAHHDMFEGLSHLGEFNCGNWVTDFLATHRDVNLWWVQADWTKSALKMPDNDDIVEFKDRIHYGWPSFDFIPSFLHVCRSGCWTPPWLDNNFIKFLASIEPNISKWENLEKDAEWSPFLDREESSDFEFPSDDAEKLFKSFETPNKNDFHVTN